jgi:ABC-type multidrug transport system ATPase subunit
MALLEFVHVKKVFGKHAVLKDVSFVVEKGEIIGLAGKSGGGKTTLMRVLMGFYHADGGQILFDGVDVSKDLYHLRQNIGFTTQDNSFYEKLTVFENLEYFGQMYGVDEDTIRERVPILLGLLELSGKEKVLGEDLSGGMKRRLDFAISLIHDPSILILDEPTTGLDPMLREQMWRVIKNIQAYGKTVIVSTHFFDELESYCDRVVILHLGKIVGMHPPKWYAKNYYKDFAKTFSYILSYHDLEEGKLGDKT